MCFLLLFLLFFSLSFIFFLFLLTFNFSSLSHSFSLFFFFFPSFIYSYTVSTLIQTGENTQEFSVCRRYKDFEWLHESLSKHCQGVLIPPLPKKDFFSRFDEEFIQSRIRGLEAFLHRILRHPLLHQQTFVRSFLQDHNMETSYSNFKTSQETQAPRRSESVASWFEAKFDELSVSKQAVFLLFFYFDAISHVSY